MAWANGVQWNDAMKQRPILHRAIAIAIAFAVPLAVYLVNGTKEPTIAFGPAKAGHYRNNDGAPRAIFASGPARSR